MLVYGDPQFDERLSLLAAGLRVRVEAADAEELEELRPLAIQAGQLEQGLFDRYPQPTSTEQQSLKLVASAAEGLAEAFFKAWARTANLATAAPATNPELLRRAAQALAEVAMEGDPALTVKIPEGFAFYGLFPEQYCASALAWAADHAGTWPRRALVVGIRSIGTTLSAVVKASLQAAGWQAERVTVRPSGHPFERRLNWGPQDLPLYFRSALVVDEGPGISGSSMAAVGRALAEAGAEDISFFPGHAGEPGKAASPEVRRWWEKTARYLTRLEALRWNGLSLTQSLASRSGQWRPGGAASGRHSPGVTELSGGLWRQTVFEQERDWPAVCATFERMKFKCEDGNGGAVLWKFAGLGCAMSGGVRSGELEKRSQLAAENWIPQPLETWRGFEAMPWVEGWRLRAQEAQDVLGHLGRYLVRVMGSPLSPPRAEAALARLTEMLYWNTREALGEAAAEQCRPWAKAAREAKPGPSYGDGHMGPWEWVRLPGGQVLKTDGNGHALDHTLVGEQSVLWDVAGTLVEWGLEARAATPLLCPLREAGIEVRQEVLSFYEMAYAAFRMGMTSLGAGQLPPAEPERERLLQASAFYRERLKLLLAA